MGEPEQFPGRIFFMSMFNDIIWRNKDNETECIANSHLCLYSHKDFQEDVRHSSDLGQKQSGIPLTKKDQEENEIESLTWWWSNSEKADTQFSEQRVRSLEERSKAKEVDNYLHTSVPMVDTIETVFSHNHFCKPAQYRSVSTEQSQICVKNTFAVEQEQGDLWWQSNLTHFSRQETYW